MRTLYLPTSPRRSSATHVAIDNTLQDNLRADYQSRNYHSLNALVSEFERSMALTTKLDIRPWAADVRTPGALEEGDSNLIEKSFDELLYGIPSSWDIQLQRSYNYQRSLVTGMTDKSGNIIQPEDIDRAIETTTGLIIQADGLLYRLNDKNKAGVVVDPDSEGVYGAGFEKWCLISISEDIYDIYRSYESRYVDISCRIQGFDIVFAGNGIFEVDIDYIRAVPITDSVNVTSLENYFEPGKVYDDQGVQQSYTINSSGVMSITGAVASGNGWGDDAYGDSPYGAPSGDYMFYYKARKSLTYETPAQAIDVPAYKLFSQNKVSFRDIAESMFKLPKPENISCRQKQSILCKTPGRTAAVNIDSCGTVEECMVGHEIKYVLPTEFHTVVANDSQIAVVEHDTQTVVFRQEVPEHTIKGITWTNETEIAIIVATTLGFDVLALRDRKNFRGGNFVTADDTSYYK